MKPLTNSAEDFERFLLIAGGHSAFQLLWAGIKFDLFTLLTKEPRLTRNKLAERTKISEQPLMILLTGLTALGLLTKHGETYSCSPLAAELLNKENPQNVIPVLGWQHHIVYPGLIHFADSVAAGTNLGLQEFPGPGNTIYERLTAQPEIEDVFQRAMSALSRQANQLLAETIDLSRFEHLVDMGGGDGTNAIVLARRQQSLKLTVFDSPTVCAIAEQNIKQAGLSDRISTVAGDFLTDPFPEADCYLFAHIFTIWSAQKNIALLKKSHASLPEGGCVMVFNMMGNDDETGPLTTALGSPYFLAIATGEGMLYPSKEYEGWMRTAGFKNTERIELQRDHAVVIGTK